MRTRSLFAPVTHRPLECAGCAPWKSRSVNHLIGKRFGEIKRKWDGGMKWKLMITPGDVRISISKSCGPSKIARHLDCFAVLSSVWTPSNLHFPLWFLFWSLASQHPSPYSGVTGHQRSRVSKCTFMVQLGELCRSSVWVHSRTPGADNRVYRKQFETSTRMGGQASSCDLFNTEPTMSYSSEFSLLGVLTLIDHQRAGLLDDLAAFETMYFQN